MQEINLRHYTDIVYKRKAIIILIIAVSMIAAYIANSRLPKIYQSSIVIRTNTSSEAPYHGILAASAYINSGKILEKIEFDEKIAAVLKNLRIEAIPIQNTSFVKITASSSAPKETQLITSKIADEFIKEDLGVLSIKKSALTTQLKATKDEIKRVDKNLKEIKGVLAQTQGKDTEDLASVLLRENLYLLELQRFSISQDYNSKKAELAAVEKLSPKVVEPASVPKHSVKSRPALIVLTAGLIGLIIGVVLVMSLEFLKRG